MKIAIYANARTTLEARKGVGKVFITAFQSGAMMGFLLAINRLLVLYIAINLFKWSWPWWFFHGSFWASGGIYTKFDDIGADLIGKVERNILEDDPRNSGVIADNIDDIADMGSDLFSSYAEFSCVAFVIALISSSGINHVLTAMLYHLLLSTIDIIVCLITILFATDFFEIKAMKEIKLALKRQLIISTDIMTMGIAIASWIALPSVFTIFALGEQKIEVLGLLVR